MMIKYEYGTETYVVFGAQLRFGMVPLIVETARYINLEDVRICENDFHYLRLSRLFTHETFRLAAYLQKVW